MTWFDMQPDLAAHADARDTLLLIEKMLRLEERENEKPWK
jgi:hypothetical protein